MKTPQTRLFGALAGSVLLAGASAAAVIPMVNATNASDAADQKAAFGENAAESNQVAIEGIRTVENVQGSFSYTQDATTSNAEIADIFNKAAATLCEDLPTYIVDTAKGSLHITGGTSFESTVTELQEDDSVASVLMACVCASNVAGGGAITNANVSGVTIASIAQRAQAL